MVKISPEEKKEQLKEEFKKRKETREGKELRSFSESNIHIENKALDASVLEEINEYYQEELEKTLIFINNEAVFICKKCNHHLFLNGNRVMSILEKLNKYSCPNCREGGNYNWVFSHIGNSDTEEDNYNWK